MRESVVNILIHIKEKITSFYDADELYHEGLCQKILPCDFNACALSLSSTQNHQMVWVGRDLAAHLAPAPCHGQGPLHQPRLPPAPSSLALGTARDGAPTAPRGSLRQASPPAEGRISS